MKTITVLSGKGGVGKSSLTASLAILLSNKYKIIATDCDVDASNLALLFGIKELKKKEEVSTNYKAFINKEAKNCKNIVDICAFSAITWDKKNKIPKINKFLCEGCGTCQLLCPKGISLKKVKNAVIGEDNTKYNFPIVSGQLKMGESGSGNVVEIVKTRAKKIAVNADFMIVDSSAGIGCPVIASVRDSDFVVGVTEPTPSGLSDLKRVFEIVNHFKIPHGIVINKYDLNEELTKRIENFARKNKISILGKLPYDKKFVKSMVDLVPVIIKYPEYKKLFGRIIEKMFSEIK